MGATGEPKLPYTWDLNPPKHQLKHSFLWPQWEKWLQNFGAHPPGAANASNLLWNLLVPSPSNLKWIGIQPTLTPQQVDGTMQWQNQTELWEVPDSHSRENSSSLKISVCAFVHDNSRKYLSVLDFKGVIESLRGAKVSNNFQSQSLVQCRPRFVVHLGNSPSKSLRSLRVEMPRIQATQQG